MDHLEERIRFIEAWETIIGYPYVWGAENPDRGFDCSGAVRYCWIISGRHMAEDRTANRMANEYWKGCYKRYEDGEAGDLCFYGPTKQGISHVMVILRKWSNGRFVLAGARGGNSETINEDAAYERWALVDICSDTYWRRRLQCVVNPFLRPSVPSSSAEVEKEKAAFQAMVTTTHGGAVGNNARVDLEIDEPVRSFWEKLRAIIGR